MLASSPVNSSPTLLGPATPTTTTTTATRYLAKQDRDALYQYTKHFVRKAMQIIVQSRLGDKKPTKSRVYAYNADWFNLSVKDLLQIATMTKTSLGNVESLFTDNTPFCVEISLRTPENQTMILETWCVLFNEQLADPTQKICYSVYKKMSLVLRSLICLTRSIPTYQLSRRQNSDTYVLLYRMYTGEPIVHVLGENYGTAKVGTVGTPIGSLIVNVAYRTRLTMTPQTSSHLGGEYATASIGGIQIKDDHFVASGGGGNGGPQTPRHSTRMAPSPDIQQQQQHTASATNYDDDIANSYSPPPPYHNNKSPRLAFDNRTQSSDSVPSATAAAASPISRHSSSNLNTIDEAGSSTPETETPTRLKNRATSKTQPIPMKSSQSQPQIGTPSNQQQQLTPRHKLSSIPSSQLQQQPEESSADEYSSSVGSTSDTIYYFKLKSAAFVPSVASASFSATGNPNFSSSSSLAAAAAAAASNELPPFIALLSNDFANLASNPMDMAQSPPPPNSVIEFNMSRQRQQQQRNVSNSNTIQEDRIVSPCSLPNFKMLDNHHNQFLNSPNAYPQQQHGSTAINLLNNQLEPDDFVFIESKKIAFGLSNAADDLRNFFRACENAPMLDSFQNEPLFNDVLKDLDQQLLGYESKVAEFDDLIKSLENN